jgi:hypothetical protein
VTATTDRRGARQSCQTPRKKAASEIELFTARAISAPPLTAMICARGTGARKRRIIDACTSAQTRKKTTLSVTVIAMKSGIWARSVASGTACQSIA